MQELKFAKRFSARRKQLGLTQSEVATYVGISNAAVSKWEQGLSYPDLTLLPKLATLFNMTIDGLLGYEPQLTHSKIMELYAHYAKRLISEPFEAVQSDIEAMIKEYYSCYPFLLRMSQLYLNYYQASANPEAIMSRIIELCERTIVHSGDFQLSQEANLLQASVLLMTGKPEELLQLLGEDIKIHYGAEQMIAHAHAMLGDVHKAKQLLQASMFQYLFGIISSSIESMMFEADNPEQQLKLIQRVEVLISLYGLDKVNVHLPILFYYKSAVVYMQQQRPKEAMEMLERYYRLCCSLQFPLSIKGDDYFYLIDEWLKDNQLAVQSPRDEHAIKSDLLKVLQEDPHFSSLRDEPAFKSIVTNLRHVLRL